MIIFFKYFQNFVKVDSLIFSLALNSQLNNSEALSLSFSFG